MMETKPHDIAFFDSFSSPKKACPNDESNVELSVAASRWAGFDL